MTTPYTESGKCGGMVFQRNRYKQISYPLFFPFNPRSAAQTAVRTNFSTTSKHWRDLTENQRWFWERASRRQKSRRRLGRCGRLCGFYYYMRVNVARANRGLASLDVPLEFLHVKEPQVLPAIDGEYFGRVAIGPTLFLQTRHQRTAWQRTSGPLAGLPQPPAA